MHHTVLLLNIQVIKCQQNTCFACISGLDALFLLVELTALFTYHNFEVIDNLKYSLGGKDLLVISKVTFNIYNISIVFVTSRETVPSCVQQYALP